MCPKNRSIYAEVRVPKHEDSSISRRVMNPAPSNIVLFIVSYRMIFQKIMRVHSRGLRMGQICQMSTEPCNVFIKVVFFQTCVLLFFFRHLLSRFLLRLLLLCEHVPHLFFRYFFFRPQNHTEYLARVFFFSNTFFARFFMLRDRLFQFWNLCRHSRAQYRFSRRLAKGSKHQGCRGEWIRNACWSRATFISAGFSRKKTHNDL